MKKKASKKPVSKTDVHEYRHVISGCNFYGVKFDKKTTKSVNIVAHALLQNAVALTNLTRVFNGSNVQIDSLLRIAANESIAITGNSIEPKSPSE